MSATPFEYLLSQHIDELCNWLSRNGWAGWDPYDLWDNRFGIWMMSRTNLLARVAGAVVSRMEERFPGAARTLFQAKQQVNPKAMGLFAAAFLDLEQAEGRSKGDGGLACSDYCFKWLDDNRVVSHGGCGWGYPFDWRSRVFIPRNTPTAVNSAIIGDAYWLRYHYRDDKTALTRCREIAEFFMKGLNRSAGRDSSSFCFSYTPIDTFQVHNANLFVAEFLVRIGTEVGDHNMLATGLAAAQFSLDDVMDDGTLPYWSSKQSHEGVQQDTFHSGFEIRALLGIALATGDVRFHEAAEKYYSTWRSDFFLNNVPSFQRGVHGTLEVHSCAEALLCSTQMFLAGKIAHADYLQHAEGVLNATVYSLWVRSRTNEGYFAWMSRPSMFGRIKTEIPLIRWGESWMLRALTLAKLAIQKNRFIEDGV